MTNQRPRIDQSMLLLGTLLTVATALARPRPLQQNVEEALRTIALVLGLDRTSLRVPRGNGEFELVAESTPTPGDWPGATLNDPNSVVARAFSTQAPVVENNLRATEVTPSQGNPDVAAAAAFPVGYQDQSVAVLYFGSFTESFFDDDRVTFLSTVAGGFGAHLYNANLRDAMDRQRQLAADRSNFIEIASHELRTPIAVLTGYTELMLNSSKFDGPENQWLTEANKEARRLARIVDDLVSLEWIRSGDAPRGIDEFGPGLLLRTAMEHATKDWPDANITIDCPDAMLLGDRERLRKIVDAVVDNSFRHGKARSVALSAMISEDAKRCTLTIEDDGEGFPDGFSSTDVGLFARPDYTHRSNVRGLGLGLYIVQTFLESVGGALEISSTSSGATVTLTFPVKSVPDWLQP